MGKPPPPPPRSEPNSVRLCIPPFRGTRPHMGGEDSPCATARTYAHMMRAERNILNNLLEDNISCVRVATLQQRVQTTMRQREQPRATPNTQNSKFSRSFALWRRFGYRVINLSSERKNRLKTALKCELNVLTKFICVNESHYIILQPQKITKPVSISTRTTGSAVS